MRFWDSSGLIPILLDQPESESVQELLERDPEMLVWWGTPVECVSAAARLRREGVIDIEGESQIHSLLSMLQDAWTEVLPSQEVRRTASRLLRVHPLRAADALQLSAALVWSGAPEGEEFVTFDERLALSARLEGFRVIPT